MLWSLSKLRNVASIQMVIVFLGGRDSGPAHLEQQVGEGKKSHHCLPACHFHHPSAALVFFLPPPLLSRPW